MHRATLIMALFLSLALAAPASAEPRSLSSGSASHGKLIGGKAVPKRGEGWKLLGQTVQRGVYYGTERLVETIERAGREVHAAFPDALLRIGNLSNERGGDIRWSRSHNSGRDADLAFYVTDARGEPTHPDKLVRFREDGQGVSGPHHFDAARNWALVRALVTDPEAHVDWIFVARWLEAILVEHARSVGEDEALVLRAQTMLRQPSDSAPHDDHFHVRIYCSHEDATLAGCWNYGYLWPWADDHAATAREAADRAVAEALDPALPHRRRTAALEALAKTRHRDSARRLAPLLSDPALRGAALATLAALDASELLGAALEAGFDSAEDGAAVIELAQDADTDLACEAAGRVLDAESGSPNALAKAAALAGALPCPGALPRLLALWRQADGKPSEAAWRAVERTTCRTFEEPAQFEAWFAEAGAADPAAWVATCLHLAGVPATAPLATRVQALVAAVELGGPASYHARKELERIRGPGRATTELSVREARATWASWWAAAEPALTAERQHATSR